MDKEPESQEYQIWGARARSTRGPRGRAIFFKISDFIYGQNYKRFQIQSQILNWHAALSYVK